MISPSIECWRQAYPRLTITPHEARADQTTLFHTKALIISSQSQGIRVRTSESYSHSLLFFRPHFILFDPEQRPSFGPSRCRLGPSVRLLFPRTSRWHYMVRAAGNFYENRLNATLGAGPGFYAYLIFRISGIRLHQICRSRPRRPGFVRIHRSLRLTMPGTWRAEASGKKNHVFFSLSIP